MTSKASELLNYAGLDPTRFTAIIDGILKLPEDYATANVLDSIMSDLLQE